MTELWPSGPGSHFDAFLFAQIGEDGSGFPLSVVSALARMDLDPWKEASELAQLPVEAARQRLADLLRALPDQNLGGKDRAAIAARLIALLQPRPLRLPQGSLPLGRMVDLGRIPARSYMFMFALGVLLLMWLTRSPT
jgi:hypothetical protein